MVKITRSDFSRGLDADEIVPFVQPLVDLRSGRLVGFEALARWLHPEAGLLLPASFMPLAQTASLLRKLTEQVAGKACQAAASWPDPMLLSINIAPLQLRHRGLPRMLADLAAEAGFPLHRLMIEITESGIIANYRQTRAVCEELKRLGARIALDDFGTGYSGLRHVHELPLDKLKIDAGFVRSMVERRDSRKIVAGVVALGHSLGLSIVAEGIEHQAQADMLGLLGCELGQGWLFGRPIPLHEVAARIAAAPSDVARGVARADTPADVALSLEALPAQRLTLLQAIYNGSPVGLCFLDRNRRFLTLNRKLAQMSGLPVAAHLGRSVAEIRPDHSPLLDHFLGRALEGEEGLEFEIAQPGDPDSRSVFMISLQPVRDEADEVVGVSAAVVDITERSRIQGRLQESEDHYRHMLELSPHIQWTANARGHVVDISTRWEALTGMSRGATLGRGWADAVHAEDAPRIGQDLTPALAMRTPMDVEFRLRLAVGGYRRMRLRAMPRLGPDGAVVRWYGLIEDVQDRALFLAAPRQAHAARILDLADDVIMVTDADLVPPGPTIRYVNQAFTRLTGYAPSEVIGKSPRMLQGPGTSREVLDLIGADLRAGREIRRTLLNYTRSGAAFWLEMRVVPLRDDCSVVTHFAAIQREIASVPARPDELPSHALAHALAHASAHALAHAAPEAGDVHGSCIASIHVDGFDALLLRLGRDGLDALLSALAGRLGEHVRGVDTVARIGTKTVAVCMPSLALPDAMSVAERLRSAVAATPFDTGAGPVAVSVSIGVAHSGRDDPDLTAAMGRAAHALAAAESAGGDHVSCAARMVH